MPALKIYRHPTQFMVQAVHLYLSFFLALTELCFSCLVCASILCASVLLWQFTRFPVSKVNNLLFSMS